MWPFDLHDGQWAIVNGYRGSIDHAPGRSPNNYALFALDFAKCLPAKVNRGKESCDLADGWANTVGAPVYAPVSGTIAWPDDNCLGASINIDGYPGLRVVLFHVDPLAGTTWSQLAHSTPPKHFKQGEKIGTVSAGGCIGSGNHIHMALYSCSECVGDAGSQRVGHPFSDQWSIDGCSLKDDGKTSDEYLGLLVPCRTTEGFSPPQELTPPQPITPKQTAPTRLQGTLVQAPTTFQVALQITQIHADGSFDGKWYSTVNGSIEDVIVTGAIVPFNESNRFSQISQYNVQQMQQHYGSDGTLLWFSSTNYDVGQDIWLGCSYYGLLHTNNTVQGLWYPPDSNGEGGTFQLA